MPQWTPNTAITTGGFKTYGRVRNPRVDPPSSDLRLPTRCRLQRAMLGGAPSAHGDGAIPQEIRTGLVVVRQGGQFRDGRVDAFVAAQSRIEESLPGALHVANDILDPARESG